MIFIDELSVQIRKFPLGFIDLSTLARTIHIFHLSSASDVHRKMPSRCLKLTSGWEREREVHRQQKQIRKRQKNIWNLHLLPSSFGPDVLREGSVQRASSRFHSDGYKFNYLLNFFEMKRAGVYVLRWNSSFLRFEVVLILSPSERSFPQKSLLLSVFCWCWDFSKQKKTTREVVKCSLMSQADCSSRANVCTLWQTK